MRLSPPGKPITEVWQENRALSFLEWPMRVRTDIDLCQGLQKNAKKTGTAPETLRLARCVSAARQACTKRCCIHESCIKNFRIVGRYRPWSPPPRRKGRRNHRCLLPRMADAVPVRQGQGLSRLAGQRRSMPAMSAAMASGDVQISVSQGVPPFVVATSAGQDLQMADIAVVYSTMTTAWSRPSSRSTRPAPRNSKARRSACRSAPPPITASSSRWSISALTSPMEDRRHGAARRRRGFAQGSLDMVCGWGGSLRRMKEHGNVLLTGAEKDELGILVFDVTSARPPSCREAEVVASSSR
jgi:hypothetical protein